MSVQSNQKLLKKKKVIDEINRHRWIESERAGHDIGFESASIQWLEKFSKAWMQYHMPKQRKSPAKSSLIIKISAQKTSPKRSGRTKIRSKKS